MYTMYEQYNIDGWEIEQMNDSKDSFTIVYTSKKYEDFIAIYDTCPYSQINQLAFYKCDKNIEEIFLKNNEKEITKLPIKKNDLPNGFPALTAVDNKTKKLVMVCHYTDEVRNNLIGPALYSYISGSSYIVNNMLVNDIDTFNFKKMIEIGDKGIEMNKYNSEIELECIKWNAVLHLKFQDLYQLVDFCKIEE